MTTETAQSSEVRCDTCLHRGNQAIDEPCRNCITGQPKYAHWKPASAPPELADEDLNMLMPTGVGTVYWFDPGQRVVPEKAGKIIDATLAFFDAASLGDQLFSREQVRAAMRSAMAANQVVECAKAKVDRNARHSRDSLREALWTEFPDAADELIEFAVLWTL